MMHTGFTMAASGVPSAMWAMPFVLLLLCIAVLPLIPRVSGWWHHNTSKLLVALAAGGVVLMHYATRPYGVHLHDEVVVKAASLLGLTLPNHLLETTPGPATAGGAALNALWEYTPFITLLMSMYTISGGIVVRGRLAASPVANTALLAVGAVLSNLVGTTGASVLLIRPLLNAQAPRVHRVHTIVFFIFTVSNLGGTLLPIGDPPLFLGYLRGVPFFWTLSLWRPWAFTLGAVLLIYFVWDMLLWRRERRSPSGGSDRVSVAGMSNILWLAVCVGAVALLSPGTALPGTAWVIPPLVREGVMLAATAMSFVLTPAALRRENKFDFFPIAEVACLFIGIFITLQVPLEILEAQGARLGITRAWHYFWATGLLSSVLDNAPTYAAFFQTAMTAGHGPEALLVKLQSGLTIRADLLEATSLGAVFMGAMTYIGNGPNFMVKAIAEEAGLRMPGFFGYLLFSSLVLLPVFVMATLLFI